MDDENRLREIDQQVTAVLQPDDGVVRRVLAAGLREHRGKAGRGLRAVAAVAIAASAAAAAAGGTFYWRRGRSSSRAELTITGTSSSIIVERADGKRWFFGPEPEPDVSRGSYIIVIPNQGELR